MVVLENILSQEIVQRLGWTLLHFIWQAAAVALLLAILLRVLRKSTANLRYIIACFALGLIVLLPVITIQLVPVSVSYSVAHIEPTPLAAVSPTETTEVSMEETPVLEKLFQPENIPAAPAVSWKEHTAELLEPTLPYIVLGWLVGVLGLSIWHLGGWAQLQRLRRKMVKPVDSIMQSKLRELTELLGVNRAVQLLESALVQVPTVIGWLRPVILLPASALTGLTTEQLEAMLAHELAHIKRFDYLVNMLQTVVEILGFYHPAVWWVSHKIRAERENCCDDLAVSISGDRVRYAKTLTLMEEMRAGQAELAVAASGGNLLVRIRRLVGKELTEKTSTSWVPAVIGILLIIALVMPTGIALTAHNKTEYSAKFLLDKMLEHRSKVKNLQYVAENNIWRDPVAEQDRIEDQIKRMREKGSSELVIERMRKTLSEVPETRYQILTCTVDDAEHVKIELISGTYNSSGKKVPSDDKHLWAWKGVQATTFSQRSGSPGSARIKGTPQVATKLWHPWRSSTGIFCKFLEETIAAEKSVSVEEWKDDTYRVAFDYKTSRIVAVVDPSKGYTCTERENYDKKGQLTSHDTATYEEVAEGIWFPISGQREEYAANGSVRRKSTFQSSHIKINDPAFNESYFDVDLPKGATVRDYVQGKHYVVGSKSVYELIEPRTLAEEEVSDEVDPNSWQEKFYSIYSLEDGEVLKRIAPPFIPERRTYLLSSMGERAVRNGHDLITQYVFQWNGNGQLEQRGACSGSRFMPLSFVLRLVLGLDSNECDGPPEVLQLPIAGDWVVRKNTPMEDILRPLKQIVKNETAREIEFVKKKVETEVIIARGKYDFKPLLNVKESNYVLICTDKMHAYIEGPGGGSGTVSKFLRWVGNRIQMPIIDETESEDIKIYWRNHDSSDLRRISHNDELYNEKLKMLLNNLSRQTGLSFKRDTATIEKWFIAEEGDVNTPQKAEPVAAENKPKTEAQVEAEGEIIRSNQLILKLVDPNSQPLVNARVGTYIDWSDIAENPPIWFLNKSGNDKTTDLETDDQGRIALPFEDLFKPEWPPERKVPLIFIDEGHYFAGLREASRENIGGQLTLTLQPACRVRGKFSVSTFRKRGWSDNMLTIYTFWNKHRICQYTSRQLQFEFLLPPGQYELMVYSEDPAKAARLPIVIKPGQKELNISGYLDYESKLSTNQTDVQVEEGRQGSANIQGKADDGSVFVQINPLSGNERANKGIYRWQIRLSPNLGLDHGWFSLVNGQMKEHVGGSGQNAYTDAKLEEVKLVTEIENNFLTLNMTRIYRDNQGDTKTASLKSKTTVPRGAKLQTERLSRYRRISNKEYRPLWVGRLVRDGDTLKTVVYCARVAVPGKDISGFLPKPDGINPFAGLGVPDMRILVGKNKNSTKSDVQVQVQKAESAEKLKQLALAVRMHVEDHDDNLPNTLQELKPYVRDERDFDWLLDNIEYFSKGKSAQRHTAQIPIAYDKALLEETNGTNVLFLDFSVRFLETKQLEKLGISK